VDTDPSGHRHQKLEKSKCPGNGEHPLSAHPGILKAVCHGDRESVHCEPDSQQYAFADK
jgi:hypothetical protein